MNSKLELNGTKIELKPRSKVEFARLWCGPSFSDGAALRWLRSEIANNKCLMKELSKVGYRKSTKILTITQQLIIFAHWRDPFGPKRID